MALGGRVAEEVVYGTITTGAESDIEQLTRIARQMVGRWGMSDSLGPIALLPSDASERFPGVSDVSPQTQALIDDDVKRLVDDAHGAVTALLTEHRAQLDSLASALFSAETLDAPAAYAAASVAPRVQADQTEPFEPVVRAT